MELKKLEAWLVLRSNSHLRTRVIDEKASGSNRCMRIYIYGMKKTGASMCSLKQPSVHYLYHLFLVGHWGG